MDRTKTIKFNMDIDKDKKLYEWLQKLPHGEFTELTKRFWLNEMEQQTLQKGEQV